MTVIASGVPNKPNAPETELSSMDIRIQWSAPSSNYALISAYRVKIKNNAGQMVEETDYCDGSDIAIASQLYCLVPMSHLISAYSLTKGTLVEPTIEAYNLNGWSEASDTPVTGAEIETEPVQMAALTEGAGSDETQIVLDWVVLSTESDTGGATVIAYHLQRHTGDTTDVDTVWEDLLAISEYSTVDTLTVTENIVSGTSYSFRVRAVNQWGEGPWSDTTVLRASTTPATALTPTTTIDQLTGDLVISWDDPDDRGDEITRYDIEIRDKAAAEWESTSQCDGSNAEVIASRQCSVPMLTLTNDDGDYAYDYDDLIVVQMYAYNAKGWSTVSPANTDGARAVVVP